MPIYMDRHTIDGVTARAVADAHAKDVDIQDKYGVKYLTYWCDEARGRVFCLADAPSKEAAERVHREAHGLIASEIIEVEPSIVEAFLGRIEEPAPPGAEAAPPVDTAFRSILFTDIQESTAMTRELGDAKAMQIVRAHDAIVRDTLRAHQGSEVKHTGDGIMASFVSVSRSVLCAIDIQRALAAYNRRSAPPAAGFRLRIGLSAGEPVTENQDLFGATVQLAARLCAAAEPDQILVSSVIRELCLGKKLPFADRGETALKGFERPMRVYEVRWQESS